MGGIVDSVLGGGDPEVPDPVFPNFKAGGIKTKTGDDGRVIVKNNKKRRNLINSLADRLRASGTSVSNAIPDIENAFGGRLEKLDELIPQVTPGFGRLTDIGIDTIRENRDVAIGDIKQNLNKRRILGSSFGQNLIGQQVQQFADQEEQFRAESFLQELELANKLSQQRTQTEVQGIETSLNKVLQAFEFDAAADQTELEELNNLANIAASLSTQSAQIANENNALRFQQEASQSSGFGQLIGQVAGFALGGPAGAALGGSLGSAVGGGGSSFSGGSLNGQSAGPSGGFTIGRGI